jgi:hypothetical protein
VPKQSKSSDVHVRPTFEQGERFGDLTGVPASSRASAAPTPDLAYDPRMEPAHPSPTLSRRLTDRQRAFLEQPLFAAIATTDASGAPRQAVIWYRLEADGRIMINSRVGRSWPASLQRDGRVSLAILSADGYSWIGLTGSVDEVEEDRARALDDILALAWRYHPEGPTESSVEGFRGFPRISFRIAIDRVHDHLED